MPTRNLQRFLRSTKVLAVVVVVLVVMIGVGVRLDGASETDGEMIAITERLLVNEPDGFAWHLGLLDILSCKFDNATVYYGGPGRRSVCGLLWTRYTPDYQASAFEITTDVEVTLKKRGDDWVLVDIDHNSHASFWNRVTAYVTSFLP